MKSASSFLPSLLFLTVGGSGLLWLADPATTGGAEPDTPLPSVLAAPRSSSAAFRPPTSRSAVSVSEPAAPPSAAPAEPLDEARVAALRRGLQEEKARRRAQLELERALADEAWIAERSADIATELALPRGSAQRLASVLIEERNRQSSSWAAIRPCGTTPASRARLREEMAEIRAWRSEELARLFGAETAQRIEELEGNAPASEKK